METNLQQGSRARPLEDDNLIPLIAMGRGTIFRGLQETEGAKVAAARMPGIAKTTPHPK